MSVYSFEKNYQIMLISVHAVILFALFTTTSASLDCNLTSLYTCSYNKVCVSWNSSASLFDDNCCCTVTVNELCTCMVRYWIHRELILTFQSGTHNLSTSKTHSIARTCVISSDFLVIEGQPNMHTLLRCVNHSEICITSMYDIKIRDIHFQDCQNIHIYTDNANIEIESCKFTNSGVLLSINHAYTAKTNNIAIHNISIVNSSLAFKLENMSGIIRGRENDNVSILCVNSIILIMTAPSKKVSFYNLYFQSCSEIILRSRLRHTTLDVKNTRFTNSCLEFKQMLTRTRVYRNTLVTITVTNVTFNNCICNKIGSQLHFSAQPRIDVHIELYKVNVTCSSIPFLESKYIVVSIEDCFFFGNKNLIFNIEDSKLLFRGGTVNFISNTVKEMLGAPVYAKHSSLEFVDSSVIFNENQGSFCGGIIAESSQILFNNNVTVIFSYNKGLNGGALSLYRGSTLMFNATESNITLNFFDNTAQSGGAIYVEDSDYEVVNSVFNVNGEGRLVQLFFDGNSALFGGNQIHGGWIDWSSKGHDISQTDIFRFSHNDKLGSEVASDPVRICLCVNDNPNCNITNHPMKIYGCALSIDVVAVGQRFTPVMGHVEGCLKSKVNDIECMVPMSDGIKSLLGECTTVSYRFDSGNESDLVLLLKPIAKRAFTPSMGHINTSHLLFQQLSIQLERHHCTVGFVNWDCQCVCSRSLSSVGLSCDAEEQTISIGKQQWAGVTYIHTVVDEYPGVLTHHHCPFDYCKTGSTALSIHLGKDHEICAFNRTGILCGGCETGFSRILGSSKCKKCSNLKLLFVIPSGILAGLVLIALLMMLNLTVSVGTINGLIFYSNFIQAQRTTFFSPESLNSFLSMFIAWLNLDLGTESCFYDGFDSYIETWLQFCFPLYIWLLAIAIVISSHYSYRISRISSRNALQVLATLFLISYTKVLRLVIDVVSFTTLKYPDGYTKVVWLYDGNIDFMKGRHIPLFLVTLLLLCLLSLPYTASLFSIQLLLRMSHYRVMFWIHKLKPFFDAYTGPYRPNHRYWTGLLLVVRIVLLVIFSLYQNKNPTVSLLCTAVFSFVLLAWLYFTGWVYESLLNNCLEFMFLLNLALTSIATILSKRHEIIYTSTGIAFVVFVGIILYHAQKQLFQTRIGAKLKKRIIHLVLRKRSDEADDDIQLQDSELKNEATPIQVTYSVVELTQPLLDDEKTEKD